MLSVYFILSLVSVLIIGFVWHLPFPWSLSFFILQKINTHFVSNIYSLSIKPNPSYRHTTQNRLTHQILRMWQYFKDLNHVYQRVVSTVEDSVLHTEMENFKVENQKKRMPLGGSFGMRPWVDWDRSGLITEMRYGLLDSVTHSLPLVSALIYRPWWSYHSGIAVAGSFRSIRLGITSPLVPPTRVPRRFTTERLVRLLTSFTQPPKWKHNRWLRTGGSDVGILNWLVISRMWRVRCLWWWTSTFHMNVGEVTPTLVLMDTYITLMM